jgi:hypothetical protein
MCTVRPDWFCQLSRRVFGVADQCWNRFGGLHDPECDPSAFRESIATERGGDDLLVTTARTEEIAEFTMLVTGAVGRTMDLEAAHTSGPSFDAAMVLFNAIVADLAWNMCFTVLE